LCPRIAQLLGETIPTPAFCLSANCMQIRLYALFRF
jgi:hypothetical protein